MKSSEPVFATSIAVRFGDCDPAGIVFYPRYFEMINNLVEDWCAIGLGHSFRSLHMEQGLGLPTVHVETDFVAASELGEILRAELVVKKMGSSSLTLDIRLSGPDQSIRVRCTIVLVMLDLQKRSAVRLPELMRSRIARFCTAQSSA
ncbi:thioesterase family protein [Glaciimonas sp. PAMC28666]|uniref:acyl-CoA thioesterase n=1 Tax=Glaciimonas sp. PAMC28666 TaxID=2807626 RepID=UPI001965047A|nr:acyl-CoA thioesterase [Glaciimonas sp. PAMC28666]QRX81772.1 acyl-CoA thioesterase [Glaciimonas sp. PAMC28666]